MRRTEQYSEKLSRLYPELHKPAGEEKVLTQTVTFQVTDDCNLACKYCYQMHKGKKKMSFETAKKMVDLLLSGDKGVGDYINPQKSPGLIVDFIGGEPLLEIDLIDRICSYTINRMIELSHPWLTRTMFSICSNGVCYFEPEVQRVLQKWNQRLSFSVTVDGNKELHDSCRVFPDGRPSYDLAIAAAKDWVNKGGYMGSKVTIAPANVMHVYDAITHMIELGYNEINANCVYEEGWKPVHATVFYDQLKKLADYILNHNLDMERDYYISLFEEKYFHPKQEDDLENWCGGNGVMLAVDPDGVIYPCLRYMESSLAGQQKPYSIGDVDRGICQCDCHKCRVERLKKVDRRTQSTDECFYCPIAEGCAWCTAYNYQVFGTPDARATYICNMHKARALGNIYFWNKYYKKHGIDKHMENYVPEKWVLDIITQAEWNMLNSL
jgi:radical SAM domain protein